MPYSLEARKIMKAEKQREQDPLEDTLGSSTASSVLCKSCSALTHRIRSSALATEAKVVSDLHFGIEDRNLQSVPSPGNGHFP